MGISINGGYAAYVYAALLNSALFYLQRPAYVRARSEMRGASATVNAAIDIYCIITALAARILKWGSWALSIYVGYNFGWQKGVALFVIGGLAGLVLSMLVPVGRGHDLVAHAISIPLAIVLVPGLLFAVGLI